MEETKWLTKTKIIIMASIILVIGLIIIFFVVHKKNLRKEYINFEKQLEYAAPNYLLKEKIRLKEDEWREIKIKDLLKQKLLVNKRASDCEGYVLAQGTKNLKQIQSTSIDEDINAASTTDTQTNTKETTTSQVSNRVIYNAYIKCKNIYTTKDYGKKPSEKKKNKTETQTQKDTEKPKIRLFGDETMTLKVGEKYKELKAMAVDNIDGDISQKIKISGKVNTKVEGTYTVKYTVKDSSGNKATATRTIIVENATDENNGPNTNVLPENSQEDDYESNYSGPGANRNNNEYNYDNVPPIITFNNASLLQRIPIGRSADISSTGIYGFVARDSVDGNITSKVRITGDTGVINTPGTYNLYYEVTDSSGNRATATRQFEVYNPNTIPDTTTVIPVSSVSITPNSRVMNVGESFSLYVSINPGNATNKALTYTSSNTGVATVDSNGNVRAVSKGSATIKAVSNNGKSGSCTVTVR